MAKDSIRVKYSTGLGEVTGFVSVAKPSTTYDKDGLYQLNILIDEKEGKALQKKIAELIQEQFEKFRKNNKKADITACIPYVKVEKDENGRIIKEIPDPDGRYILKTKNKAYIKDGKVGQKIQVFDSKLNPVDVVNFGEGSKVKLGITLEGYSSNLGTGVSVKLRAVQIIEVKNYSGFKAEDFFGEEDGYEYSEDEEAVTDDEEDEEADF